ncbi:MAG: hypothetical protein ACQERD_12275 [Campylobacterota bacterium]
MNFEKTFKQNIEFMQKHFPNVYKELENVDFGSDVQLILNDNPNKLNINYKGHNLYPDNSYEAIKNQVDTFVKSPTSFYKKPTINKPHELYDFVHDQYLTKLEKSSEYLHSNKLFHDYAQWRYKKRT